MGLNISKYLDRGSKLKGVQIYYDKPTNKTEHHSPSELYPKFFGKEGPVESRCPDFALDYLKLLWPNALTSLIVTETNRYARWKKHNH